MSWVGGGCRLWAMGSHPLPGWPHYPSTCLSRYGAITFGNVQKSIPASFGARAPAMVRKIAVRRAAQVSTTWPQVPQGQSLPEVCRD